MQAGLRSVHEKSEMHDLMTSFVYDEDGRTAWRDRRGHLSRAPVTWASLAMCGAGRSVKLAERCSHWPVCCVSDERSAPRRAL